MINDWVGQYTCRPSWNKACQRSDRIAVPIFNPRKRILAVPFDIFALSSVSKCERVDSACREIAIWWCVHCLLLFPLRVFPIMSMNTISASTSLKSCALPRYQSKSRNLAAARQRTVSVRAEGGFDLFKLAGGRGIGAGEVRLGYLYLDSSSQRVR